jgi:hypothetical protein
MHGVREPVEAGGLIFYGPNIPDQLRRVADYVDKILRGTKPGDIPVEQSTRLDLVMSSERRHFAREFSAASQSKIKPIGKAVLNLRPKFLKIRYALVVHLSPKTHLPLRAVLLIFLCNFLNAKRFGSCGGLRQSRRNEGKKEHNECRQCCPQC